MLLERRFHEVRELFGTAPMRSSNKSRLVTLSIGEKPIITHIETLGLEPGVFVTGCFRRNVL